MSHMNRRQVLAGLGVLGSAAAFGFPLDALARISGDTLIIGQTGDIVSLDPARRVDTLTGIVQRHLYSPVLSRMPDMSVGPGVAVKHERVSPTKWRLTLREGMKFSNGEPVDAEAVRFTIARLNAEETKSPIRSFFVNLVKVEVESPTVVTIETSGPDALFEARMTNLQLVPPKYTTEAGAAKFNEAPIGSGPYTFERWKRNEEVVLVANPTYGGPDKPKFKRLVFRPIPEELARISAVKTGAVHLVTSLSPSQAGNLKAAEGVQVLSAPSNRVMVVQFNKMAEPANDPRFRRAVGFAINRDEIIKGLMKGHADPVTTIYGAAIQGVPKIPGDFPYDPDQAKKLIEELGLKGKEIEVGGAVGRYPLDRETALAVGAQLRRVGLNVKVRTTEYGTFAEDIKANRVGPVFIQPHGNVWLDPLPQIIAFMYSKGHWSGWRDPGLDVMIDKANNADGPERVVLVGDLIKKLRDEAIAVPLFAHQVIYGAAPGLSWRPRSDDLIIAEEIG